jgi:D-tyrosyl-tRNA(Tyr) deacylase
VRALVQRVSSASVKVDGEEIARIGPGMLVLIGVGRDDGEAEAAAMAAKLAKLRIFDDADGRLNEPLGDREVLCVSQFTLYGDTTKGNRPGFDRAAEPGVAERLYGRVCDALGAKRGVFGERMAVELVNDGPVTLMVEV